MSGTPRARRKKDKDKKKDERDSPGSGPRSPQIRGGAARRQSPGGTQRTSPQQQQQRGSRRRSSDSGGFAVGLGTRQISEPMNSVELAPVSPTVPASSFRSQQRKPSKLGSASKLGSPATKPAGKPEPPAGAGSGAAKAPAKQKQATLGHMAFDSLVGGKEGSGPATELTQVEFENFQLMFSIYDADGSATIDVHEIGLLMEGLGCAMEHDELVALIGGVDTDGNDELEFDEFLTLMRRWKKHKGDGDLMATGDRAQHIDRAVKSSLPSATILPGASWKWQWDLLIMLCTLYYCIAASPAVWVVEHWPPDYLRALEVICTVIFLVDMSFHARMLSEGVRLRMVRNPHMELTQLTIVSTYLRSWRFVPDFLSSLPFDLVLWALGHDPAWKIVYHLRLCRLITFKTLFDQDTGAHQISARYIRFHFHQVPLLNMLFSTIIVIHWFTSCWLVVNRTVHEQHAAENLHLYRRYLPALYWVLYTLTSTGYGDIDIHTDAQYVFACVMFCIGAVLNALLIGKLTGELMRPNIATAGHARLRTTLEVLQYLSIPEELQEDVLSFLAHAFASDLRSHEELFESLPEKMECALKMHIKIQCLSSVGLFKIAHPECKIEIAGKLDTECYAPDQFVVVCGQPAEVLYVLSHGFCDVLRPEGWQMTIRKGDYFGETELLLGYSLRGPDDKEAGGAVEHPNVRYDISIKTLTYTEFYQLTRDRWEEVLVTYPGYGEEIKAIREQLQRQQPQQQHRAVVPAPQGSRRCSSSNSQNQSLQDTLPFVQSAGRASVSESEHNCIPFGGRMSSGRLNGAIANVNMTSVTPQQIKTGRRGSMSRRMSRRMSHRMGSNDDFDDAAGRIRRVEHSVGALDSMLKEVYKSQQASDRALSAIPAMATALAQLSSRVSAASSPADPRSAKPAATWQPTPPPLRWQDLAHQDASGAQQGSAAPSVNGPASPPGVAPERVPLPSVLRGTPAAGGAPGTPPEGGGQQRQSPQRPPPELPTMADGMPHQRPPRDSRNLPHAFRRSHPVPG